MQKGSLYIFPKFSTLELLNLPMLSNLFYLPGALHQKPQSHISHKTLQGKNEKIIATQPLDQRDKKRENRLLNPRAKGEGSQGGQEHCQTSSYCLLAGPGRVPQPQLCQLPTHQGAQGVGEEDRLDDLQRYLVVEEKYDKDEVDGDTNVSGARVPELELDTNLLMKTMTGSVVFALFNIRDGNESS